VIHFYRTLKPQGSILAGPFVHRRKNVQTILKITTALVLLFLVLSPAYADWVPGMPAKWVQMPDETSQGIDVNATWKGTFPYVKTVADDFLCKDTGLITDIHIWGSWLNDIVDPNPTIVLSVYADVPATVNPTMYSHPAMTPLWQQVFVPNQNQYLVRPWKSGVEERFYDPNLNQVLGFDHAIYEYNFNIPNAVNPLMQYGTLQQPKVYWLGVQVMPSIQDAVFGWKTSTDHWNDDATFADTTSFGGPLYGPAPQPVYWLDLHDPATSSPQISLDQAFVINGVPEPSTLALLLIGAVGLPALLWTKRQSGN
jgi:hypothetical protein